MAQLKEERIYREVYNLLLASPLSVFKGLTVDEIARSYNVHYSYLSRLFSKRSKTPLGLFLNRIKFVKIAIVLINNRNLLINELSKLSGYSATRYFIELFKGFFGITPGNFKILLSSTENGNDISSVNEYYQNSILNMRKRKKNIYKEVFNLILLSPLSILRDITVMGLAEFFKLQRSSLSRIFSKRYHISLDSFLHHIKLIKGLILLYENENLKIKRLSKLNGFKANCHYINIFKDIFGVTPGTFKKYFIPSGRKSKIISENLKEGESDEQGKF